MVEADAVPHGGVLPQVARLCGNAVGSLLTVRDEAAVTRLWLFLADLIVPPSALTFGVLA